MSRKKLSAIKRLEGNPGRQIIQDSGIEGLGDPFTSDHLMMDAKACIEVIMSSMPPGVYRKLDSFALAAYGMAWGIHKRAAEEIGRPDFEWLVRNGQSTPIASPWLKILNEQTHNLMAVGARLGLDPLARQGMHLPEQRDQTRFRGLIGSHLIEHSESSNSLKSSPSQVASDKESDST